MGSPARKLGPYRRFRSLTLVAVESLPWRARGFVKTCRVAAWLSPFLVGVCAALATAQQPPKPHASPAPRLIILPPRLVAGAQATLAVLDSQGRLLPNVTVELSGGQNATTDMTGRAIFKAPDQPGTLVAKASGQGVTASATVVAPMILPDQVRHHGAPGAVHVASYPHAMTIHDRFTLEGAGFRGAADSNHVYLNGDPCLVVASSPVSLVALPGPSVPIGDVTLHVTVGGIDAGQFPGLGRAARIQRPHGSGECRVKRETHCARAGHNGAAPSGSSQWIAGSDPARQGKRAAPQDFGRRRKYRAGRREICDRRKLLGFGETAVRHSSTSNDPATASACGFWSVQGRTPTG